MKRIFFGLLFIPAVCSADWFGPSSYEDCIIEGMKGTTSNVAANEIRRACRAKFPKSNDNDAGTQKITGDDANNALNNPTLSRYRSHFGLGDHKMTFHNPLNVVVRNVTIAVQIDKKDPILFKAPALTKPMSLGTAFFDIGLSEKSVITSWWIAEIETAQE